MTILAQGITNSGNQTLDGVLDFTQTPTVNGVPLVTQGGGANSADRLTTPRSFTIGNSSKAFDGTGDVSWTLSEIGAVSASGTVASANTLATPRTINGTSFNGSSNILTVNWGTARSITIGATGKSVNGSQNLEWTATEILAGQTISGTVTATSFAGNLIGSASSASTLVTPRTINGTSFNGSANITTNLWGASRSLRIGKTSKTVNGSSDVAWTSSEIGFDSKASSATFVYNNGRLESMSEITADGTRNTTFNYTGNVLTSMVEVLGNKTTTTTYSYSNGNLTGYTVLEA